MIGILNVKSLERGGKKDPLKQEIEKLKRKFATLKKHL